MRRTDRAALWGVAGLTMLAFGLRLYRIDADSIWWDEGISLHLARGTWAALFDERAGNVHPPLYFMLLKLWLGAAGESVFAARGFSLLFTLPGVALAYDVARRAWGRQAGLVSAALAAVGAVFLVHGQDVRAYGLLPVVNLLLLALADRLIRNSKRRGLWAALAFAEAAALLLHYLSAIAILYVVGRLAAQLWRQRRELWRVWLASQAGAALLITPWAATVLAHRAAVREQLALGSTPHVPPASPLKLVALVWTFLMTGHPGARYIAPLPALAGLLAGTLAAAVLWLAWTQPGERPKLALSTLDWLLPTAGVSSVWLLRPLAHPRYTLLWAGALWAWVGVVLGRLVTARGRVERALGTAGLLAALALNGLAIQAHLSNPRLANHDVRGAAQFVHERAAPGDAALVPFKDWSMFYYDTSPVRVSMIDFREPEAAWRALGKATEGAHHVFVMEYEHTTRDPLGVTAYALERAGALEEVASFWGLEVFVYRLDRPVEPPKLEPVDVKLGAARLVGVQTDPAPSDETLTVALAWQTARPGEPLKATLQLQDSLGNKIAQDDRLLLDPLRRTSDEWPPGEVVVNTYLLPLPKGTPPVSYTLAAGVYPAAEERPGDLQPVTEVVLLPPTGSPGDPYGVGDLGLDPSVGGELAPGLRLAAASYFPRQAHPGDAIDVTLRWQASSELPDLQPALHLEAGNLTVLDQPERPANGQYPTSRWSPGEVVLDRRRLRLPPDSPPGTLTLSLALNGARLALGDLLVVGGSTFEAPQPQHPTEAQFGQAARLVGYDLSGEAISPGESLRLTLYWQAVEPGEVDYTVFVHLMDAGGTLVGQHDYPPVGGMRPTSGWQPGEYLVDVHDIRLLDGVSPVYGGAHLMVGLYDPRTLERVPLAGGGDALELGPVVEVRPDT